jgi:uncharacterized peroxidase-related enzyme
LTGGDEPAYSLARRTDPSDLAPQDTEMLRYARRLTANPASIGSDDVHRLKAHGFDDRAVLDICQVVSYYNYVNRLADGLGVELEDFWTTEEMIISRAEFEAGRA